MKTKSRQMSLRVRLIWLVIGSVVPLLAFSLVLQYLQYRATFANAGQQAQVLARSMALVVEQSLATRISALDVLSHAQTLQANDIAAFQTRVTPVVTQQFPGSSIVLLTEDGRQLMNTLVPPGTPLSTRTTLDTLKRVFATKRPAVSNVFSGNDGPRDPSHTSLVKDPTVSIEVPVKRADGSVQYSLAMHPHLDDFANIIRQQAIPPGWVITIYDARGTIVGRTLNPEQFAGQPAAPGQAARLASNRESIYEGISREGVSILAAFSRSEPSGWAISVFMPRSQLTRPALTEAVRILVAGIMMLLIGLSLAMLVARQILNPIAALRRLATQADRPTLLDPPPTGLREADEVAEALRLAEVRRQQSEDDERRARDALRQSEQKLQQTQKLDAIGSLTGGMAHDFNNLLGVIIGNLDLARPMIKDAGDADELVGDALDAALRGADLNRRLLAFARRQPLQPSVIVLNDVIDRTVKLLGRMLGENIEIALDLTAAVWPVLVDPTQLETSLMNLATNARDAMPKGGRLTIATANRVLDADYVTAHPDIAAGEYAMIEVSDNGTGIASDVLAQIFEPFYTTKQRGQGTGLGLSMVFGFIKQSGGHINVYSEPGVGTIFRLYLPHAVAKTGATPQAPAIDLPSHGGGETVLAVEDNAALRRVVVRQLTELGYRPVEADSAAAALAILESRKIDAVFTDIVMPGGMDGFELARIVIDRWPDITVILTSGFPEPHINGNLGARALSVRLLSKPYRREDLARTLRELLHEQRNQTPPSA